ncbi:hypothetical protein V2G26_015367 [Clonostachys chloroleuca]
MEESLISLQVPHWLETLHAFLAPMEELLNHLPLVSDWLGASVLYLPPMEELLDHQQHSAASVILAAIHDPHPRPRLSLARNLRRVQFLRRVPIQRNHRSTPRHLCSLQLEHPTGPLPQESNRPRKGSQTTRQLRQKRPTPTETIKLDISQSRLPRARLRRFKDQWKDKSFPGSSRPPWIREQRLTWERNVCALYMEALVRDHDALEGQLAAREASLESLRGRWPSWS